MISKNLFEIGIYDCIFSIRWYKDSNWGYRYLGWYRRSLDLGHVSLLLELYL